MCRLSIRSTVSCVHSRMYLFFFNISCDFITDFLYEKLFTWTYDILYVRVCIMAHIRIRAQMFVLADVLNTYKYNVKAYIRCTFNYTRMNRINSIIEKVLRIYHAEATKCSQVSLWKFLLDQSRTMIEKVKKYLISNI